MTVRRYAVAAAACELIPVPLLDTVAQNQVRRRALTKAASSAGRSLSTEELHALADEPLATGWELVRMLLLWPFKKLFRTVFMVWTVWVMFQVGSDVVERAGAVSA
ncbi:MAG: hypothetical protein KC912_09030 [Proteobacteria bacterium]|nr:hypothetical protein [Pseudomonadota bacterium]